MNKIACYLSKAALSVGALLMLLVSFSATLSAQDIVIPEIQQMAYNTPTELVSDASVTALLALVTGVLAYFSKVFPVLGSISEVKVRAFTLALLVAIGAAKFQLGFFGATTLPFILSALVTIISAFGLAGSAGLFYDLIRWLSGNKIKSL